MHVYGAVHLTENAPYGTLLTRMQSKTEKKYPQVVFCMSERLYVLNEDAYRAGTPQDMPGPSSSSHDLREAAYPIITSQESK